MFRPFVLLSIQLKMANNSIFSSVCPFVCPSFSILQSAPVLSHLDCHPVPVCTYLGIVAIVLCVHMLIWKTRLSLETSFPPILFVSWTGRVIQLPKKKKKRRNESGKERRKEAVWSIRFCGFCCCSSMRLSFGLVWLVCHHFRRRQTKAAKAAASSFCLACLSFFTLLLLFRLLLIYHAMSYDYVGFFKHFKE